MSGIYIKGMKMPRRCIACPIGFFDNEYDILHCSLTGEEIHRTDFVYKRSENCPLVPIPDHGRLIDADAFIKQKTEQICENCDRRRGMIDGKLTKRFVYAIGDAPCRACDTGDMLAYVDDAPTIIPEDLGKGET